MVMQISKSDLKRTCNLLSIFYIKHMRELHTNFILNCKMFGNHSCCNCMRLNDIETIFNCIGIRFDENELKDFFYDSCKGYIISSNETILSDSDDITYLINYQVLNDFLMEIDEQNIICFLYVCVYYLAEYFYESDETRSDTIKMFSNILFKNIENYDKEITPEDQHLFTEYVKSYPLIEHKRYFKEKIINDGKNSGYVKCLILLGDGIEIVNKYLGSYYVLEDLSPYLCKIKEEGENVCV